MRKTPIKLLIFSVPILLLIGLTLAGLHRLTAQADNGPMALLDGQGTPVPQQAQFLRATDTNQTLNISVSLQVRDPMGLDNLVQAIYNPQSPQYRHYLTPEQFQQNYAPTSNQVQQVVNYLQGQHLTVTHIAPNNLLIDVTSTVAPAQQAFNVHINNYRLGQRSFFANATPARVPSSLRPMIIGIVGLDNTIQLHSNHQHSVLASPTGLSPAEIANAYNSNPFYAAGLHGEGQTVALLELDGYQLSDIQQYMQTYNLGSTSNIARVLVDGFNGAAGMSAIEVELDMELLAAVAPRANQIVYEGPNTLQGFSDILNKIVTDNKAQVASISWGLCEATMGSQQLQTFHNILQQGAAQGISFLAATGDAGAYDCQDNNLAVASPASDTSITAVGGTTLRMKAGSYDSETAWSNPNTNVPGPNGAGGGGGLSMYFKSQNWQVAPGVQSSYTSGSSCKANNSGFCREVPDVSANANPDSGYAIYCTVTAAGCPGSGWLTLGGTSASAPVWAGGVALLNQYLRTQGKAQLGLANSSLYALANTQQPFDPFHDITAGNNLYYPAGSNYDLATGLGSPDFYNIARDLAGVASGTPTPIPTPTTTTAASSIAQDNFQRANQSLWGTASNGQTWGGEAKNVSAFSIANNTGQVVKGGAASYSAVLGPTATNAEVLFTGSITGFANNSNIGAVLRWTDGNNWYKAYIDGNSLFIQKRVSGTTTVLSSTPFTATAGTSYSLRFRAVGTTLSAKVWATSSSEPANWMATVNDSALQSGYCGLRVLSQSYTVTISSFQASSV